MFKFLTKVKHNETKIARDIKDRTVQEIKTTFTTVLGEKVEYISYCKLSQLVNGLQSFMEHELLSNSMTIGDTAYNTAHIVSLQSKITADRLVKVDTKERETHWEYRRNFSKDELET